MGIVARRVLPQELTGKPLIHIVDLVDERRFDGVSFVLHRRRQQLVVDAEELRVKMELLHLEMISKMQTMLQHRCRDVLVLRDRSRISIWGGGGAKRLCARTHITSAKPEVLYD